MDIEELLVLCMQRKGSDLHVTVGMVPIIRIDGELIQLQEFPVVTPRDTAEFVNIMTNDRQQHTLNETGQVDFSYVVEGIGRYRANIFKQRGSYAIVCRTISISIPAFEDLNLPDVLKEFTKLKKGLVLVTGPTGSGKSTTLAAMIDLINKTRKEHIITLEDPVEYLHRHRMCIVNQREIGSDSESYASALRAALREDPDIILVGEMRDLETISTAITAAETGHVVFSTLHTIGAAKTIDRIIDVFPPNQQQQVIVQLASVIQGVVSQCLLKKKEGKGRTVALEIMRATPAIRNIIRENKTHQLDNCIQTGARLGMQTMNSSLISLYRRGMISIDDVYTCCTDVEEIKRLIGGVL
jgi:twitching motility protein PilT